MKTMCLAIALTFSVNAAQAQDAPKQTKPACTKVCKAAKTSAAKSSYFGW